MRTVTFDVETHSREFLFDMEPEDYVRLAGYKWSDEKDVHLTEDLEELRAVLRSADLIVGHNIWDFDLRAVFGHKSDEPLDMAMSRKVYDTWTHAVLVHPAPYKYMNRHGKLTAAEKPEQMLKWFSLDEQAFQLGVSGKTDDLKALAFEFGSPLMTGKTRINDGFGKIPVDDKRYRDYLIGDVLASEAVAKALLKKGKLNDYAWREQEISARIAVMSSNGFRVDQPRAQARVDELSARREEILTVLEEKYDFPTEGDAPWATDAGKRSILAALADQGITPKSVDWPKTPVWEKRSEKIQEAQDKEVDLREQNKAWRAEVKAGDLPDRSIQARERWIAKNEEKMRLVRQEPIPPYFGLSMGGEELQEITKGTPAEDLGQALAELKGQRSLAQLALDSVYADGFAHPEITMLQRSGRASTTKPGLTVWTSRGENAIEKAYFIPDDEDEVLVAFDYSNADARIVAAYSGDKKYAERFEPEVPCQRPGHGGPCSEERCGYRPEADGHLINAIAAWGYDVVMESEQTKAYYRNEKAKKLGHGWNYGGQAKGLARQTGLPLEDAKTFCEGMEAEYQRLIRWQNSVRKKAQAGYVVNHWGRKMVVEKGREFTQAPALMGQSGTREIVCDALLRMPVWMLRRVKAWVHDELIFSLPRKTVARWSAEIKKCMEATFDPGRGGQAIHFPVSVGKPARNWHEATH